MEKHKTNNKKDIKTYEYIVDDVSEGVQAISLVENPAIEVDFVAFSKENVEYAQFKTANVDKQMVIGPLLIPNKPVYRVKENEDGSKEEYNVVLSEDSIRKTAELYMKNGYTTSFTEEHGTQSKDNIVLIESWIVEDTKTDKSYKYGYRLPVGTWCVVAKVYDKNYWNEVIKSGKVKGFSIEGIFTKVEKEAFNASKYEGIDFVPPADVAEAAKSGLSHKDNDCSGGTRVGLARANQLANQERVSPDTINRMVSFFARHKQNRVDGTETDSKGCPTAGYVAWMLWGGDAGERWANKVKKQMDSVDDKFSIQSSFTEMKDNKPSETVDSLFTRLLEAAGFSKIKEEKKVVEDKMEEKEYQEKAEVEVKEEVETSEDTKMEAGESELIKVKTKEGMEWVIPFSEGVVEVTDEEGVSYEVTIKKVAVEPATDPSETGESVESPREAVAESFSAAVTTLKKEVEALKAELKATKEQSPIAAKFSRHTEGVEVKPKGIVVSDVMKIAKGYKG